MKKLLIGTLAIMFSIFGLQKLADALNTTVRSSAVESERMIAANNGGFNPKVRDQGLDKA